MKNGTFIYHNGQLQYSHKEFPKEPEYCSDFGDVILICGDTFCKCDRLLKIYRSDREAFYASLLPVVNPEFIKEIYIFNIPMDEGDHWDVPDGVEVTEDLFSTDEDSTRTIKAVRLSIKATENSKQ